MIRAFVLGIVGSRSELVSSLRSIRSSPHVDEAYLIWGTYDVIAKVTVPASRTSTPCWTPSTGQVWSTPTR